MGSLEKKLKRSKAKLKKNRINRANNATSGSIKTALKEYKMIKKLEKKDLRSISEELLTVDKNFRDDFQAKTEQALTDLKTLKAAYVKSKDTINEGKVNHRIEILENIKTQYGITQTFSFLNVDVSEYSDQKILTADIQKASDIIAKVTGDKYNFFSLTEHYSLTEFEQIAEVLIRFIKFIVTANIETTFLIIETFTVKIFHKSPIFFDKLISISNNIRSTIKEASAYFSMNALMLSTFMDKSKLEQMSVKELQDVKDNILARVKKISEEEPVEVDFVEEVNPSA